MINILISSFRNKKINIIYIAMFILILLTSFVFQLISGYYEFFTAEKYGAPIENRTYFILEEDEEKIDKLKNSFEFENFNSSGNNEYNAILKNYIDTKELKKYFEKHEINGILDGSANTKEIELMEKKQTTFDFVCVIILIIVLIVSLFIIKNIFMNELKNIALLKILGYSYIKITLFLFAKLLVILLISFIMNILLLYFVSFIYLLFDNSLLGDYINQINILSLNMYGFKFIMILLLIDSIRNGFVIRKIESLELLNS